MKLIRTTPVPNSVFDVYMRKFNLSEIKVLLVIIRKTLGWKGEGCNRKQRDWISTSQLSQITGISKRSISGALNSLIEQGVIKVTGMNGSVLNDASERKGQAKLYFELGESLLVDNELNTRTGNVENRKSSELFSQDLSKKVHDLAQKLLITKQNLQN